MESQHHRAIMAISLLAAFADDHKDEREREHLREMAESLNPAAGFDLMKLYQDVLLRRVTLEDAAGTLDTAALRHLAFEMAVGVCDADGVCNDREKAFLQRLAAALQVPAPEAASVMRQADEIADVPLRAEPAPSEAWTGQAAAVPVAAAGVAAAAAPATARPASIGDAEIDSMILNASILNGALELLPQSLASMAIIPLQTRLVYRIGKVYGYELDKGHIADFLATVGVGLTSQYVEQFGRKLVGGLLGKVMGGMGRAVGSVATGSAFSFASTYALGKVAQRYYAGGRTLNTETLKSAFSRTVDEAKGLQQRYAPQIRQRAQGLDVQQLMRELKA
ncbi:MAG: TerB family tellurite resistance protein [Burkholderiaceae bacterium]|nr:TerB family tellurite resistance protein [Burkholderiaceae bacterium]